MNIQHIKRACMNARTAMIYDTPDGEQWIGNGAAAYLVEGIRVDERALTYLFNMSEKQQSEMYMLERSIDDPRFTDAPYEGQREENAVELGLITYLDEDRLALKTDGGVMFIRYAYVSAIKEKYRSFTVRWWDGRPLVAVYDGMFCKALIVPMGNDDVENIRIKLRKMSDTPFRWKEPEDRARDAEEQAEALMRNMEREGEDGDDADTDD